MMNEPLAQALIDRLPSPQGIALAIMNACARDDVTLVEVTHLVQADPALSGRLLERANAATVGGRPVVAIAQAVARMGLQSVKLLALSFSLIDQYSKGKCQEFDYGQFWSYSLLMGVAMSDLGAMQKLGSAEELFTCGMLSQVGRLALATAYPIEYGELIATGVQGKDLLERERAVLHIDHLFLAQEMMKRWGIPPALVDPVQWVEDPSGITHPSGSRAWDLSQTLHLAKCLADFGLARKAVQTQQVAKLAEVACYLGIKVENLGRQVDSIIEQWQAWAHRMRVQTQPVVQFDKIAEDSEVAGLHAAARWLRVLVVEDDPVVRNLLAMWLDEECHHTVQVASDGQEALSMAVDFAPHVVITDWRMPRMDGVSLCKALRSSAWGVSIYVIMLTSAELESELVDAFDAGVDDFVAKPLNLRALSARLKGAWRYVRLREASEQDAKRLTDMAAELALTNRRLQLAALTDPLTGLANRRAGLNALSQACSAAARREQPLTLISFDIDHFKQINDQLGHAAGDAVLQALALALRTTSRKEDSVCRWGGEEFLVISPAVTLADGIKAAERLRQLVAGLRIEVAGKPVPVQVSLGVATWDPAFASQDELLSQVDQALYGAKEHGRNCVGVFSGGTVRILNTT